LGAGAAAQSLRGAELPAEFPPLAFEGLQFVDSRGCVFIRAGFEDAPTWVPRLTRDRRQVCGFDPTFGTAGGSAPADVREVATSAVSAPNASASPQALATPFVQVGTFGVEANATNSAGRLRDLGLPVVIDLMEFSGKTYRVVLAGPFADGAELQSALRMARELGFSDAFLR
jgi:hypothetical protein